MLLFDQQLIISDDYSLFLLSHGYHFLYFLIFFFGLNHLLMRSPILLKTLILLFGCFFDWTMIHNNALNDWIVSFPFYKSELNVAIFHSIFYFSLPDINSCVFDLEFQIFLMGSIFGSCFLYDIHV